MRLALATAVVCACGSKAPLLVEIPLATEPGLSGLAIDDDGALWTVAERANRAYRVVLDRNLVPAIETFVVSGVPPGLDLEGIAWLGGSRFAFGTEGAQGGAMILTAQRDSGKLIITGSIALPAAAVGIELAPNLGAEGICGRGETIIAGIEGAGTEDGKRWAPILRVERGAIARSYRMWLTTQTGKLSGLDCTIDDRGTAHVWAIERHFEVTRLLVFDIPPGERVRDITPRIALDLGPVLNGRLNLEGIARAPDGRTFAITDNQWKTITGPSLLLVLRAGAAR